MKTEMTHLATFNLTTRTEIDTARGIAKRILSALAYNGPRLDGAEYGTVARANPVDDEVMQHLADAVASLEAAVSLFGLTTDTVERDAQYHTNLNRLANCTILK